MIRLMLQAQRIELTPYQVGKLIRLVDYLSDFREWYAISVVNQILISEQLANELDSTQIDELYELYSRLEAEMSTGLTSSAGEVIKICKNMPRRLNQRYLVAVIKDILPPQLIEVLEHEYD